MPENQKLILDKFQEHIDADYHQYCNRHNIKQSTQSLLTFLIDENLIPSVNIKRYTVAHEFEQLFQEKETPKSRTVVALSDKFNIPERTIWSILKKKER